MPTVRRVDYATAFSKKHFRRPGQFMNLQALRCQQRSSGESWPILFSTILFWISDAVKPFDLKLLERNPLAPFIREIRESLWKRQNPFYDLHESQTNLVQDFQNDVMVSADPSSRR
jgi:hypothetical protein